MIPDNVKELRPLIGHPKLFLQTLRLLGLTRIVTANKNLLFSIYFSAESEQHSVELLRNLLSAWNTWQMLLGLLENAEQKLSDANSELRILRMETGIDGAWIEQVKEFLSKQADSGNVVAQKLLKDSEKPPEGVAIG